LGNIPIEKEICEDADRGEPFVVQHANSKASGAFMEIVRKMEDYLKKK
jgi:MinD-like ATPase involved in chromosome partitioning or flagellar assembly